LSDATIGGIAVEVWTMSGGIAFDSFYIGRNENAASKLAESTWRFKYLKQSIQADVASRKAQRLLAEAAYEKSNGGWSERLTLGILITRDFFAENPIVASVIIGVIAALSLACCCCICCGEHSHSHAHGDHSHGHFHDSINEGPLLLEQRIKDMKAKAENALKVANDAAKEAQTALSEASSRQKESSSTTTSSIDEHTSQNGLRQRHK
jgi:hypothetical protein